MRYQVTINATPEAVYQALTEQEGIKGWWSEQARAEPEEGFVNEVSFYGGMAVFQVRRDRTRYPGHVG